MKSFLTLRGAALIAASLILASCNGRSSLPVEPVVQPAPVAVDPRLCAPLKPEPPVRGSVILPVTPEEVEAVRDHLTSDAEARDWAREGWDRAAIARLACGPPRPG
ncbi:MAG: hypothetical protein ACT6RD_11830 [Brevundimonas sp.]|uniref:hypothetical protein n=1 Tax=Brevundimonas sp. TaxID=1871086 RepID=UPI0040333D5B